MTKDEAIGVLEDALRRVLRLSFDQTVTNVAKDALLATMQIEAAAPVLAAVGVEKPQQGERNAASPAAPAFQDDEVANGKAGALTEQQMRSIAKVIAGRVAKNASVAPELCFAPALFALQDAFVILLVPSEQSAPPVPRMGGITKPSCETCNDLGVIGGHVGQTAESFDYVTEDCPDCTPAAPIPEVRGEREAFEAFMRKECGADDESLGRRADGHYSWGRTCDMFAAWQARGQQQAGVADGLVAAVRDMLDNDGCGPRYDAMALRKARAKVSVMLPSVPVEA